MCRIDLNQGPHYKITQVFHQTIKQLDAIEFAQVAWTIYHSFRLLMHTIVAFIIFFLDRDMEKFRNQSMGVSLSVTVIGLNVIICALFVRQIVRFYGGGGQRIKARYYIKLGYLLGYTSSEQIDDIQNIRSLKQVQKFVSNQENTLTKNQKAKIKSQIFKKYSEHTGWRKVQIAQNIIGAISMALLFLWMVSWARLPYEFIFLSILILLELISVYVLLLVTGWILAFLLALMAIPLFFVILPGRECIRLYFKNRCKKCNQRFKNHEIIAKCDFKHEIHKKCLNSESFHSKCVGCLRLRQSYFPQPSRQHLQDRQGPQLLMQNDSQLHI